MTMGGVKMKLNTQTDKRWKNDIMTDPPWQPLPDYIKDWGCLLTSFSNIIQIVTGKKYTPADLNNFLKENKGYAYLLHGNTVKRGNESFILYDAISEKWGLSIENVKTGHYTKRPNTHYICRFEVKYKVKGKERTINHYSNVLTEEVIHSRRFFEVFDVYSGETMTIPVTKVSLLKRVMS